MNEKTKNIIGGDFNLWGLIRFSLPSILTQLCSMIFQSLDDGLFVSRYVGELALASINLLNPLLAIRNAITHLFAIGGSTMSANLMGKGQQQEAKRVFSRLVIAAGVVGTVYSAVVCLFAEPICYSLGADETTIENSLLYLRIVLACTPVHMLSVVLNSFYSTCGKPKMGLFCSFLNGSTNIVLDFLLIPVLKLGVVGSSLSTVLGDLAVVMAGIIFYFKPEHEIHFVKPEGKYIPTFWSSAKFGSSQFVNALCISAYQFVSNKVILSVVGADGIAANAIISDLRKILNAFITGYVSCIVPVIAYNVGAKNNEKLKKLFCYNFTYWFFISVSISIIGELLRKPLLQIYFTDGSSGSVFDLTYSGLTIEYAGIMLTTGCIILNRMFTATGETRIGAFVSFMRNIALRIVFVSLLPVFLGITGVWLAFPTADLCCFIIGVICFSVKVLPKFGLKLRDLHFRVN